MSGTSTIACERTAAESESRGDTSVATGCVPTGRRIAYIMSRFPKLTETFILFEIDTLDQMGLDVAIFPLLRARNSTTHVEAGSLLKKAFELFKRPHTQAVMHREAQHYVDRARFTPLLNWPIFLAQTHFLLRKPRQYFAALATVLRANWGSWNYLLGGLAIFPKAAYIARKMQEEGIDHVHAHFVNHPTTAAYIIHALTGIPYTFTAHGADLHVDQHMLCEKVGAAQHVITVSDYNKQFIIEECGEECREKITVLRCGVDTSVFQPALSNGSQRSEAKPLTIVCTGTFYEVKGQQYLLSACRLLKERGIEFECHLVGDGPQRPELQQQVGSEGTTAHVHFRGQLTRPQIADLLQRADVAVVPSVPTKCGRREGIPVVLMEAMASGLPVVASNISGIPEAVDHERTGILVPPRDAPALADALERIARDPDSRARLGQAGRQRILQDYNLHTNVVRLAGILTGQEAV